MIFREKWPKSGRKGGIGFVFKIVCHPNMIMSYSTNLEMSYSKVGARSRPDGRDTSSGISPSVACSPKNATIQTPRN